MVARQPGLRERDYECTPWGIPLRNVFGWQKPCYLLADGGYAKSYAELLATTEWHRFGRASGNPKCAQCMTHVGYEPSAVEDSFSRLPKFLELLRDIASTARLARAAHARQTKSYETLVAEYDSRKASVAKPVPSAN